MKIETCIGSLNSNSSKKGVCLLLKSEDVNEEFLLKMLGIAM